MPTVAETIKRITREHLEKNKGIALGQCLTAVGWVGGTVPEMTEEQGLVEFPMADVANGYFAVGAALRSRGTKRRPIYIVRYQGFAWFNLVSVLNYAAKSKEMWGIPCPLFVRLIGMDGGIGPVASGSHHSLATRMPGIFVAAPMTSNEYEILWDWFMSHDDPVIASEHRRSFPIDYEMESIINDGEVHITFFPISSTRLNVREAVKILDKEGIKCNVEDVFWLKPFFVAQSMKESLSASKYGGVVLDGDYENGVAKCIAYDLMMETKKDVRVLGLEERTAGFAPNLDNLPPTAERICKFVRSILEK